VNTPSFRPLAILCLALLGLGAPSLHAQREKLPMEDLEIVEKRWPQTKRTYTGLRYIILEPGDAKGPMAEKGMEVAVLYKGMLLDGTVFDESPDAEHPLKVRVGRGNLIDGWEEALQKMHKGEKWLLIVPSEMAYGARGKPPTIKRDATLVFEMQLIDFHR
jgi:FKBP-type peptidyl-prolyl cis-trans isomerase